MFKYYSACNTQIRDYMLTLNPRKYTLFIDKYEEFYQSYSMSLVPFCLLSNIEMYIYLFKEKVIRRAYES